MFNSVAHRQNGKKSKGCPAEQDDSPDPSYPPNTAHEARLWIRELQRSNPTDENLLSLSQGSERTIIARGNKARDHMLNLKDEVPQPFAEAPNPPTRNQPPATGTHKEGGDHQGIITTSK
jgi:hypothetical protein